MNKDSINIILIITAIISVLGLLKCSTSSEGDGDSTIDTQIDPVSKVCSNIPKCFGGTYPAFFGKSKKECMMKISENLSDDEVDALIKAGTKCNEITPVIRAFEGKKTCEILKGCMGDTEFTNMFGTIDGCVRYGEAHNVQEEDFKCVDQNSSNCDVVANYCLSKYEPDAGVEDAGGDVGENGGEGKACVTDTNTYYCADVCAKFYTCTGEYCPQGGCTKESCIHGCKTESVFTIELMCCIMEKSCSEINTCLPK